MSNTNPTVYMNLPNPVPGVDPGPDWADNLSACMIILDQHNHSSGSGQQIQPNGLNINSDLTFQNNNAILLRSARFSPQSVPIPNSGSDVGCLYVSGNELYYNDVTGGNQIKITTNGSVNAGAGSITGLPSGTASASFAGGTFIWQSATATAANMDAGSYVFRNSSANSKGLTLQPPNAMAADYSVTLPSLPAMQSFMTLDSSGNMAAPWTVDGVTIQIIANQLVATTQLTAASQTEVNVGTNTTKFVNPSTLAGRTNVAIFNVAGTYTWTAPAGCNEIVVWGRGGAGGGGSGTGNSAPGNQCGGAGGGGSASYSLPLTVTPGTQYAIVVGAGGAGGAAQTNNTSNGNNGSNGSASSFSTVQFKNIGLGGGGGQQGSSSSGGSVQFNPVAGAGSGSSAGNTPGSTGGGSIFAAGGAGGGITGAASGGGGGGAGDGAGAAGAAGIQSSVGPAGGDGTNGGGGGGSGATASENSARGGNGSDGQIIIVYENVSITNTNT